MVLSRQRRFPRTRSSPSAARTFVTATLAEWGIDERREEIQVCVSELATNAVLHGSPRGREFDLRLTADGSTVRVEVRDSGAGRPEIGHPGPDRCSGRGLHVVSVLSDDFGVTEHVVGKTVWFSFRAGAACSGGDAGAVGAEAGAV